MPRLKHATALALARKGEEVYFTVRLLDGSYDRVYCWVDDDNTLVQSHPTDPGGFDIPSPVETIYHIPTREK